MPEIIKLLDSDVNDYKQLIDILTAVSPAPVIFHDFNSSANGYYSHKDGGVHIKDSLPELQKIKTTIHEIAHAILHNKDTGIDKDTSRGEKEVEAESVAYTVCSYLGLDTSDYSFGYIAGWSQGRELNELKKCMEAIRSASNTIINGINNELELRKLNAAQEVAFKLADSYLYVRCSNGGYEYSVYNHDFQLIDGGELRCRAEFRDAVNEIAKRQSLVLLTANYYDVQALQAKVELANIVIKPEVKQRAETKIHAVKHGGM